MERVPQLVRRGKKDRRMGAPSELDWEAIEALRTEMRVELIQELIPLGLAEVGRVLDEEVRSLLGNAVLRWKWSPGSTLFLVW